MSNLAGLLNESENAKKRLEQAIVSGDYDEMTAIEKSQVELSRRIFFARRDDFAEQLEALESSRSFGLSLRADLQTELTAAAEIVADIHKRLVAAQRIHEEIKLRQYFNDTTIEQERTDVQALRQTLNAHIKSRLNGIPDEMETITNESTY